MDIVDIGGATTTVKTLAPEGYSLRNNIVYDGTATWANSAAANTAVNIDIPNPEFLQPNATYLIEITNPSTVTAINVVFSNKETLGGTAKYCEIGTGTVAVNTPDGKGFIVQGLFLGEAVRLILKNATALGVSDGFTAYIRVRML